MRTMNLFAVAFAALAIFASCSKEEQGVPGAELPGQEEATGNSYATFNFKTPSVATRATESAGADADAESEKKLKEFRLLIFDNRSKACEYNEVVDLSSPAKQSVTVLLNAGEKSIYALANMESNATLKALFTPFTVGGTATLDNFLDLTWSAGTPGKIVVDGGAAVPGTYSLAQLYNKTAEQGFPMSSSNAKTYDIKTNISSSAANGATPGDADNNNFIIDVDFMLAKVGVHMGAMTAVGATVKASDSQFTVRNLAKSTYLTQQFQGADVKSFYHSHTWANQASYDLEFDYSSVINVPVSENKAGLAAAGRYVYAAENTHMNLAHGQGSYVIMKTAFLPEKVVTAVRWDNGIKTTEENYAGKAGAARTYIMLSKAYTGSRGTLAVGMYFASQDVLQLAMKMMHYGVDHADTANPAVPAATIITYTEGISYYRINLGEGNSGSKVKYGISRGNRYIVSINKITGPSYNSESGTVSGDKGDGENVIDPSEPVDKETNIVVSISAVGWLDADLVTDI